MKIYTEIVIGNLCSAQSEILTAQLAAQHRFTYEVKSVEEQNWNALWESNFNPVAVDDFVFVRVPFHALAPHVQHEIIITPKMSFGTGHHATTYMMLRQMHMLNFNNKQVFDFGTGTGVLAILAEKLGAAMVFATDNDDWSVENALENIGNNHCKKIKIAKADGAQAAFRLQKFDIVLANINKNVIVENAQLLSEILLKNGYLLLSGLLAEDEADIVKTFTAFDLQHLNTECREQWISLLWLKC
jgi:ribosomal protein L11 methyltransferase